MKRMFQPVVAFVLFGALWGCTVAPVSENEPLMFPVRAGVDYKQAWEIVVDVLRTNGYDFESLAYDDGYIKTNSKYDNVELQGVEVKTTISVKFVAGKRTVRMTVSEDYLLGMREANMELPRIAKVKAELRERLL